MKKVTTFILFFIFVFNFSAIFLLAQDFEKEVAVYEEKVAYNPYDTSLKRNLAVLYHNWAMDFSATGNWQEAIAKEKRAYELDSSQVAFKKSLLYFYNSLALELKDQKKYQKAMQFMKKARDLEPGDAVLKKNLAMIYLESSYEFFEKSELSNAERMLTNVESLDKENPYLYVLKGEIAYSRDNYFKADENWSKALKLNPGLYNIKIRLEKLQKEKKQERNFSIREVGNFKLKFEGIEKGPLVEAAAETLNNAYRDVGQDFNAFPRATVPVIIYPQSSLKKLDYFPDWAAGTYDGKIRFGEDLGKSNLMFQAVLYHEYTHVIVRFIAKDNVPLWFNEGLAEYEARNFKKVRSKKARRMLLARAVKKGTIFSFDKLADMNLTKMSYLSPHRIELVYAQSESFVTYIIERSSVYDMKKILELLGNGETMHRAVKKILFVELDTLERDWKYQFE